MAKSDEPTSPFRLLTSSPGEAVTLADVSAQVGALAAHVGSVHQEVALTRSELRDLSALVTGDHAPRLAEVEKKTLGGKAIALGRWGLIVTGALGVAVQLASMFQPKLVGPLETLLQMLSSVQ